MVTFITTKNSRFYLCFSLICVCHLRPNMVKMVTLSYLCPSVSISSGSFLFSFYCSYVWFWAYLWSSQFVTLNWSHLHYFCNMFPCTSRNYNIVCIQETLSCSLLYSSPCVCFHIRYNSPHIEIT